MDCTVEIAAAIGMNVIRYTRGRGDIILPPPSLAQLKALPTRFGIPVLSPPGRTSGGKFQYAGRSYQLPLTHHLHHLHGELNRLPWQVERHGASATDGAFVEAVYAYHRDPQRHAYFPHKLEYRLRYRLKDGDLFLEGSAHNTGEEIVPFALGFHPYFVFAGDLAHVLLYAPPATEWPKDREGQAIGPPEPTPLTLSLAQGVPLAELKSSLSFLRLEPYPAAAPGQAHIPGQEAPPGPTAAFGSAAVPGPAAPQPASQNCWIIEDGYAARQIRLQTDTLFSNLVLFKPPWANAISLEPHTCVPDAFNLPWDSGLTGARGLEAGSSQVFSWSIQVKER
jgi:aldose 1-epimerase